MSGILRRHVALVLYRDPGQLGCIERPGFAGARPGVIIELAPRTRLRPWLLRGGPRPFRFSAPILFAPPWRRTLPALLRLAAEARPAPGRPVVLVCHIRDAHAYVDSLGPVSVTRLLWHPADRPARWLGGLLGRMQRSALGPSLQRGGLYLSAEGRPASGDDWLRASRSPILDGLTRLGRFEALSSTDGKPPRTRRTGTRRRIVHRRVAPAADSTRHRWTACALKARRRRQAPCAACAPGRAMRPVRCRGSRHRHRGDDAGCCARPGRAGCRPATDEP